MNLAKAKAIGAVVARGIYFSCAGVVVFYLAAHVDGVIDKSRAQEQKYIEIGNRVIKMENSHRAIREEVADMAARIRALEEQNTSQEAQKKGLII
jgi:hypothetical protein